MKHYYYLVLLFFASSFSNLYSQDFEAKLLEIDFTADAHPAGFISSASGFFFNAIDNLHGRELWFSDGTSGNTRLVKDILPGEHSSGAQPLAILGDLLLFNASADQSYEQKLWVSDGTEEGTYPIGEFPVHHIYVYKNKAYFTASREAEGAELWVTDGTKEGTGLFLDLQPGKKGSNPSSYFEFDNLLFFLADDGVLGTELWKTDGTPAGTSLVKDINSVHGAFYSNTSFLEFNGNFYFMADDGKINFELYKSDGTEAGTQLVKDINLNGPSAVRLNGTVTDNGIFFTANDGVHGYELWKSDGSDTGTVMLTKDNARMGSLSSNNSPYVSPEKFATVGNAVFFITDGWGYESELWKTDGTEAGMQKIVNSAGSQLKNVRYLKNYNGKVMVVGSAENGDSDLWITDGTRAGTTSIPGVDISTSYGNMKFELLDFNGNMFFVANSEVYGYELWKSDGTAAGTELIKDINHFYGSSPQNFVDINGLLYFSARRISHGNQLMISNGAVEGTKMVKMLSPSGFYSLDEESETIAMNNEFYFSGRDDDHGYELWKSDGTETGTVMIKDINPGSQSSMTNNKYQKSFSVIGNKLYFQANNGVNGNELWVSDGSREGTKLVKDIYPGTSHSNPSHVVTLNNFIYFKATDQNGTGIWRTDGTGEGTVKILNLKGIGQMAVVNNRLIIIANTSNDYNLAHDLWSSDGTAEGTHHIMTYGGYNISSITVLNDKLFFVARHPETIRKGLFKTDGTVEGTRLIFDSLSSGPNANIKAIQTCGDYIYVVTEETNYSGQELWRTAGNPETTINLTKTETGVYQYLGSIACFQDKLYFNDGPFGREIWSTDGSIENTGQITYSLKGGPSKSDLVLNKLIAGKNVLYFTGTTPENGQELYAIQNGELATLPEPKSPPAIPTDIFSLTVGNETCTGKDNGYLLIESTKEYPFTASLNGETFGFTKEFHYENLPPGNYTVCITVDNNSDFEQCFEFTISAGASMTGSMQSVNRPEGNLVNVNIKRGTAPFSVSLDGKEIGTYNSSDFSILTKTEGILEIASGRPCEGKLIMEVTGPVPVIAYPNPTTSVLNITVPDPVGLRELPVHIYNAGGQLISSENYSINNNMISVDVQKLIPGIYYAVLKMKTSHTIQFSKK